MDIKTLAHNAYEAKIRQQYLIPEGDKESYQTETQFIIEYREKLKVAYKYFWDASYTNYEKNCEKGMYLFVELAKDLVKYMRSAQPSNIMRKLRFIQKIDQEVKSVKTHFNSFEKNSYAGRQTVIYEDELALFLKGVCADSLVKGDFLNETISEMTAIVADKLKNNLKNKFYKYIQEDNSHPADIYFLLGASLQKSKEYKELYNSLYSKHCENCNIDDCMLHHCSDLSVVTDARIKQRTYEEIVDLCIDKIKNRAINNREVQKLLTAIDDKKERKIITGVLNNGFIAGVGGKKIILNWGPEHSVAVLPENIKYYLLSNLSIDKGIDYKNVDDVAILIISEYYDFSPAIGNKEYNTFETWYKEYNNNRDKIRNKEKDQYVSLKKLFDEFDNDQKSIKNKIKPSELGEE